MGIKYEGLVGDCLGHCSHCQTMGLYYRSALPICSPSSLCCTPSCPSACAQPAGVVGDAVHAYADAAIPGFVQHGALATVAAPAADAAAAEDAVVSVEKRDAEADPEADADADAKSWWYGYYGHPYGYYGHHGYYGHFYGAYGHPWYGYHGGVGCRNGYGALVPCAHGR